MPYINVNDAYILDNTGKQVDDAVDYALANSNRNLLDNPWFTVNQRNVTTFTSDALNIDRWSYYTSTTSNSMTLTNSGIASTYSSGYHHIAQRIPQALYNSLIGKTATLSVLFSDGTILSGTGKVPETAFINFIAQSTGINGIIQGSNQTVYFRAYNNKTIRAVKLELGSYSTLANDVPPDYGEEFRKCARYFFRAKGDPLAIGYISADKTNAFVMVSTPAPMRTQPTVAVNGTFNVRVQGYTHTVGQIISVSNPVNTGCAVGLKMTLTETTNAIGPCASYASGASGYIDLSADL